MSEKDLLVPIFPTGFANLANMGEYIHVAHIICVVNPLCFSQRYN